MRGGLSTIDRDYGLFNKVHHDIGTHVVHHLFPQIPHYHLTEATEARAHTPTPPLPKILSTSSNPFQNCGVPAPGQMCGWGYFPASAHFTPTTQTLSRTLGF